MRPVPHEHACTCEYAWGCANAACTDHRWQWCRRTCQPCPDALLPLMQLEAAGHAAHQLAYDLGRIGHSDLALAGEQLRACILARAQAVGDALAGGEATP